MFYVILKELFQADLHNNKNIKMMSFKSSQHIQKKEGGPDRSVSDNQSSSVTLNELAIKARKNNTCILFKEIISTVCFHVLTQFTRFTGPAHYLYLCV